MATICAWLVCICGVLSLLASSQGTLHRVVSVQRKESSDGSSFILTATFEAEAEPYAMWWRRPFHQNVEILQGHTMKFDEATGQGTTTLEIRKDLGDFDMSPPILNLGKKNAHYVQLYWNLEDQEDKNMMLDYPTAILTPASADLSYNTGDTAEVKVVAAADRGEEMSFFDDELVWSGQYVNADGTMVSSRHDTFFMETIVTENDDNIITTTTFNTSKYAVSGMFSTMFFGAFRPGDPLQMMTEGFIVKVHNSSIAGPFPDGYKSTEFLAEDNIKVCGDATCYLTCRGFANDLDTVKIFKVTDKGREDMEAYLEGETPYALQARVDLLPRDSVAGNYTCVATEKDDSSDEDDVTVVVL